MKDILYPRGGGTTPQAPGSACVRMCATSGEQRVCWRDPRTWETPICGPLRRWRTSASSEAARSATSVTAT
eukprot:scaffold1864_cov106-Isochrysis_galbana.AAC.5